MKKLLKSGEWTQDLYNDFMNSPLDSQTKESPRNTGLYATGSVHSSREFGDTLIQVEVEPGYKYLNLGDPSVRRKLKEKGITEIDWAALNPKIGMKRADWRVFKNREGVRFKPFDSKKFKLKDLSDTYEHLNSRQKQFFASAVKDDIAQRSAKDLSVFKTPFVSLVEEEHGRKYVSGRINSNIKSLIEQDESLESIQEKIKLWSPYLNRENKIQILRQASAPPC